MRVFNLYLPCTCPVLALYLPCTCPVLGLQKGSLFNIASVIILQCGVWNSVVLCGSFRRTKIDPAFFHFQYTLYQILQCPATALRLPSDCPSSVLQVSSAGTFHVRRCNNTTFLRGHSGTTFRIFTKFSAFVIVIRNNSEPPLFLPERFAVLYLSCACKNGGNPV